MGTATAAAGPMSVYVNGRFRVHKTTGLQRYAEEIIQRLGRRTQIIEPRTSLRGPRGHMWEQMALPARVGPGILWSPCNTGPCWFHRQVVTVHDMFPLDHPEWFTGNFLRAYRFVVPALIRGARRVIAVSNYTRRRIIALTGVPEDKVELIYSGIGSMFTPQPESSINAARRAAGLPTGRYLLSVSSIEPRKNVTRLLQAWEKALPSLPSDINLVLVGGMGNGAVFSDAMPQRIPDRVVFPGYVSDAHLPGLYSGARAFVFPSLAEGFGFPPLEAMACGTPVVTSSSTSLVELCRDAALLVEPTDTDAIARAIHAISVDDDMCRALRSHGLERVTQLDWDTAAMRTWDLLSSELTKMQSLRTGA